MSQQQADREPQTDGPKLQFLASLPPIASAISLDGYGDGARIKLDVPRNYVDQITQLQRNYAGKSFLVQIIPMDR